MNKVLWLDDMRDPFSKDFNTWYPTGCEVYWVKTFEEFTSWITTNGLPYHICFDHDLYDEHVEDFYDSIRTGKNLKYDEYEEKCGYHCVLWLIEYCNKNSKPLPKYSIHTFNSKGRINLRKLLEKHK